MTSDSEHTNQQRSPQQAQGRKWPILVLLLGVVTLALALTACGGESSTSTPGATNATTPASTATTPPSTSTPGATTGSPPTATATSASTPTPKPTEAAEVGESAGISRETREFIEAYCALSPAKLPATWGGLTDLTQKFIDFYEKNNPPREMRDYVEANEADRRALLRFAKEQDPSASWMGAPMNDPEVLETNAQMRRARSALDDAVVEALNNC